MTNFLLLSISLCPSSYHRKTGLLTSIFLSPLISVLYIPHSPVPIVPSTPLLFLCGLLQECAWCWVAWSFQTDGTPRWSETCVGSRQGNTLWAIALYAGPICWPSWASWMPSFSPSWPLSWVTGRQTSILMTCRQTTKVSERIIIHCALSCCLKTKFYLLIYFFYVYT